jgi:hypothetical protein
LIFIPIGELNFVHILQSYLLGIIHWKQLS